MKSRASSEPREWLRQLALGGPREKLRVVHPQHGDARFALEPGFVDETFGIANFQRPFLRHRPIAEPQGKSAGTVGHAEFATLFHLGGFHGAERAGEFRLTAKRKHGGIEVRRAGKLFPAEAENAAGFESQGDGCLELERDAGALTNHAPRGDALWI